MRHLWVSSRASTTLHEWSVELRPAELRLSILQTNDDAAPCETWFRLLARQVCLFANEFDLPTAPMTMVRLDGGGMVFDLAAVPTELDLKLENGELTLDEVSGEFLELFRDRMDRPHGPSIPTLDRLRASHDLTRTEGTIAVRLAQGQHLKAIAYDLGISVNTVRSHLRSIYSKTGVNSQAQLVGLLLLDT